MIMPCCISGAADYTWGFSTFATGCASVVALLLLWAGTETGSISTAAETRLADFCPGGTKCDLHLCSGVISFESSQVLYSRVFLVFQYKYLQHWSLTIGFITVNARVLSCFTKQQQSVGVCRALTKQSKFKGSNLKTCNRYLLCQP